MVSLANNAEGKPVPGFGEPVDPFLDSLDQIRRSLLNFGERNISLVCYKSPHRTSAFNVSKAEIFG